MASTFDVSIAHKVSLVHEGTAATTSPPILLVFINGLMLPRAFWQPTLSLLPLLLMDLPNPVYALTYDRYGQGESRHPPPWKPEPHDLLSAAHELDSLLTHILTTSPDLTALPTRPHLLFVSHSIGVPLARLHNTLPTTNLAHAHLLLDSNITTTDFISLLPDPTSPTFSPDSLPANTTPTDLLALRTRILATFHPSVPNPEGLSRNNIAILVPSPSTPPLRGPNNTQPYLTVLAHDPAAFAEEGLRLNGTPKALSETYIQPAWDEHNEGLLKLVEDQERVRGMVVVEGAGHFVQRDKPERVAKEVAGLARRIVGGVL